MWGTRFPDILLGNTHLTYVLCYVVKIYGGYVFKLS